MRSRKNISSGAVWEDLIGYSRAVRINNIVEISGTTSSDGEKIIGIQNVYEQTKFILTKIERSLIEAGATLNDVIRVRMFVTYISKWEEIGKAHNEFFKNIKPAATMVEVKSLIHPGLLIEIEATAIVQ